MRAYLKTLQWQSITPKIICFQVWSQQAIGFFSILVHILMLKQNCRYIHTTKQMAITGKWHGYHYENMKNNSILKLQNKLTTGPIQNYLILQAPRLYSEQQFLKQCHHKFEVILTIIAIQTIALEPQHRNLYPLALYRQFM